jgi:hypothetical protein
MLLVNVLAFLLVLPICVGIVPNIMIYPWTMSAFITQTWGRTIYNHTTETIENSF